MRREKRKTRKKCEKGRTNEEFRTFKGEKGDMKEKGKQRTGGILKKRN